MSTVVQRPRVAVIGATDVSALGAIADLVVLPDAAIEPLTREGPDLLVLDAASAPDLAAFCHAARDGAASAWLPILVLGADGDGAGIAALDAGADDVLGPDARPAEILARAVVLLRLKARHDEVEAQATRFADWTRTLVSQVAEQVEQLQRAERLRRFLSPQVADVVAGDEALLESHRREIAVVFCDLRGFTAFSETAEPEEVMGVLREYHTALGALVFRFEATLERFAGDAILAFFNDPVPCPDPAARATRMALAMRDEVRELVRGWRKRGHELDLGVGIAVGYATLGRIGFEGRFDYGAVGSVVNLAARLCAEAFGGQILLSERAHTLVEDLVHAEALPPVQLKGFQRPTPVYSVVGLRAEVAS